MNKRTHRRNIQTPQINKISNGLNKLEQTLTFEEGICGGQNCDCLLCQSKRIFGQKKKVNYFDMSSKQSDNWLLKILNGLSNKDAPTLKIYIPDIVFIDGDILKVFYTDVKDNRIKRMDGTMPTKALYLIMLRLKKNYKQMLEQKFQKTILNQINPEFVHEKYMQHVLPAYFNDSQESNRLHTNKMKFMKYVFHKDEKLLIQSIQQHKINENEPFCSVRYKDGNMQLFSKKQFENYTIAKIHPDIVYVQSYIKQKQETKAHFTSCYSFMSTDIDMNLFNRAEKQILVLIGGIGKYSEAYEDIQSFEDATIQLMKQDVEAYINYMTYKIVHYLSMVSRIYVKHIKINWILNDLKMVYILNVFEFQTTEICLRSLKYRLPPKQQNLVFYKDSENFINLYKQIQVFREAKRVQIRNNILKQREQMLKKDLQTQKSTLEQSDSIRLSQIKSPRRSILKGVKNSKTISTVVSRNPHTTPMKKMSLKQDRYNQGKQIRMTAHQRKRRQRYMSVLQKYAI